MNVQMIENEGRPEWSVILRHLQVGTPQRAVTVANFVFSSGDEQK